MPDLPHPSLAARRVLLALAVLAAPLAVRNAYYVDVVTTAGLYALLALGLNLVVGCTGMLHLGFAAFFAVGAYTYGSLSVHAGVPFWIGVVPATLAAALAGVLFGIPAMRVRGDYLAIVTLGFGEITRLVLTNLERWTGGPNGLLGIAHPSLAWGGARWDFGVASLPYYYLVAALVAGVALVCGRLCASRIGRAWAAIREDELAASCVGIDVAHMKLAAQGCGAAIAGLAGAVFAAKQGTITPESFDFLLSVMVLAMVVLGGMGRAAGPIVGALVLGVLPEALRGVEQYRMLLFGAVLVVMMRVRPQGLIGAPQVRRELAGARMTAAVAGHAGTP
jgi:branched-chain amino acid transport system permease protein